MKISNLFHVWVSEVQGLAEGYHFMQVGRDKILQFLH
jgi:hypothetical protein